ncbi:MAG: hypothetical protein M1285_05705, partial [Candidatus Thermoplasmatota archaeon]|nr:hypothetical protein [Candidatus Thermoplasmatota archaeon]
MVYFSNDVKVAGAATVGATIGAVQTILLRQYGDISMANGFLKNTSGTPPLLMKQLKGFGSPSALAGIVGGIVGLALGLGIMLKGMVSRSVTLGAALVGYGSTALFTGILSGVFPTTAWSAATTADPNNPIGAASVRRNVVVTNGAGIARAQAP